MPVRFFLKGPRPLRWCRYSLSQGVRRVKGGGVLRGEDGDGDAADTGAGVLDGRVPGHADHRYPTVYWMLPQKKRDRTQSRGIQMGKGEHMENRILARLDGRVDPEWLLTLLSVLPLNTYTLEEWNEALSQAAGRRIFCPSYRTLSDYLHRLVLGVQ